MSGVLSLSTIHCVHVTISNPPLEDVLASGAQVASSVQPPLRDDPGPTALTELRN